MSATSSCSGDDDSSGSSCSSCSASCSATASASASCSSCSSPASRASASFAGASASFAPASIGSLTGNSDEFSVDEDDQLLQVYRSAHASMSSSSWSVIGDPKVSGGKIELLSTKNEQVGAVWHKDKVPCSRGFTTSFTFRAKSKKGKDKAKDGAVGGFALVLQNQSRTVMGREAGEGMGCAGIRKAIALVFGKVNQGEGTEKFAAIYTDGTDVLDTTPAEAVAAYPMPNLDNDRPHTITLTYTGYRRTHDSTLTTYIDGVPTLQVAVDLKGSVFRDKDFWIGFTGSTNDDSKFQVNVLDFWFASLPYPMQPSTAPQSVLFPLVPLPGLPREWQQRFDPRNGLLFYVNTASQSTTWSLPSDLGGRVRAPQGFKAENGTVTTLPSP